MQPLNRVATIPDLPRQLPNIPEDVMILGDRF